MRKKKLFFAAMAAASILTTSAFAQEEDLSNKKIVLIPSTVFTESGYDEAHKRDDLSTDDYTVLLYDAGETVRINNAGSGNFEIKDSNTELFENYFVGTDGSLSFIMPDTDLYFSESVPVVPETEAVTDTPVQTDVQTQTDVQVQTETQVQTEPQASVIETSAVDDEHSSTIFTKPMNVILKGTGITAKVTLKSGVVKEMAENEVFSTDENISFISIKHPEDDQVKLVITKDSAEATTDETLSYRLIDEMGTMQVDVKDGLSLASVYTFTFEGKDADSVTVTIPEAATEITTEEAVQPAANTWDTSSNHILVETEAAEEASPAEPAATEEVVDPSAAMEAFLQDTVGDISTVSNETNVTTMETVVEPATEPVVTETATEAATEPAVTEAAVVTEDPNTAETDDEYDITLADVMEAIADVKNKDIEPYINENGESVFRIDGVDVKELDSTMVVNTKNLNLRDKPGTESEVIRVLPNGQKLLVLGETMDGAWYLVHVTGDGEEVEAGYVRSLYLD